MMTGFDTALTLFGTQNARTTQALEGMKTSVDAKKKQQIEDAAQDFEAVFLSEMMKPMFETVKVDPMFGGGKGEEVFRSFLVQEYGKILAATNRTGLSDSVSATLMKAQEAQSGGISSGTSFAMPDVTTSTSVKEQRI
ncbi:MAG: rod-binding protein [Rhodospirillales bacterium]|nr:rod-binding protein [Rhodospirillales bacterium]MCB9979800.1 rod-binding protein [Rhodospirillales bacterium]